MTIHPLFQTLRPRRAATAPVGPARRLDDIEAIHRLPHVVAISDMSLGLARTVAAHQRWIEDPINGTQGVYGVHYDTYNRGMIALFSDANTAFWFRVRSGWSGVILYAPKAAMNVVEGAALLYLTSEEDHEDACLWLADNGFSYRRSQNIVPAVNQGYDTIPFIEIRCPRAAVLAKVRWV